MLAKLKKMDLERFPILISAATQDRKHGKNLNPHPVIPFLLKK